MKNFMSFRLAMFGLYGLLLLNVYTWMLSERFWTLVIWKWDIFIVLLVAPIVYFGYQSERREKERELYRRQHFLKKHGKVWEPE